MTVKELKEKLSNLPDDMSINYAGETIFDNKWICKCVKASNAAVVRVKDGKVIQRACKQTSGGEKCLIIS